MTSFIQNNLPHRNLISKGTKPKCRLRGQYSSCHAQITSIRRYVENPHPTLIITSAIESVDKTKIG